MRTADGYRFSLQFKAQSDAHRQAGEFLESLGNKKSEIIITALSEFIMSHPEVLNTDNPVKILAVNGYTEESIKAMIESLVLKVVGKPRIDSNDIGQENQKIESSMSEAIDLFMGGLEKFG